MNSKDYAAFSSANEAQLEVELGNVREARAKAELARRLMPRSPEVQSYTALVFASMGDFRRAEASTRELTNRFPSDTSLNNVTLQPSKAIIETKKGSYSGAIDVLKRLNALQIRLSPRSARSSEPLTTEPVPEEIVSRLGIAFNWNVAILTHDCS